MSTHDRTAVQTTNSRSSDYDGERMRKVVDGTKRCPVWVESVDYRGARSNLAVDGADFLLLCHFALTHPLFAAHYLSFRKTRGPQLGPVPRWRRGTIEGLGGNGEIGREKTKEAVKKRP